MVPALSVVTVPTAGTKREEAGKWRHHRAHETAGLLDIGSLDISVSKVVASRGHTVNDGPKRKIFQVQ